jgi:hypothetical protein
MNARPRTLLVGIAVPLALALAALVVAIALAPVLPDPIATHWGPSGEVDGYGPLWATAVLPLLVVLGYTVLVVAVLRSGREGLTVMHKVLLGVAPFLATMMAVIGSGSLLFQRGLSSASDAPSIVPVVLVALASGAVIAALSWVVLPRATRVEDTAEDVPPLEIPVTARATWVQSAGPARVVGTLAIGASVLAVIGGGAALWAAAPIPVLLVFLLLMLVVIFLAAGSLFWRVTVDRRGFRAISVLGWPRFSYPLSQIDSATVVDVNPIGDFGGWGLRWGGGGRVGIVLRSGPALAVKRTNGKSLVVTVPLPRTAAALLNSLVKTGAAGAKPLE